MISFKPKRRWFQFSLRTFFILMTAFCVWFGWAMNKAREQKKVVEWLRENEGRVVYDYEYDEDGALIDDADPPGPKWLRDMLGIDFFGSVVLVDLTFKPVSDLSPLTELKDLRSLRLWRTEVAKDQIAALQAALPNCTIIWCLPQISLIDGPACERIAVFRYRWLLEDELHDFDVILSKLKTHRLNGTLDGGLGRGTDLVILKADLPRWFTIIEELRKEKSLRLFNPCERSDYGFLRLPDRNRPKPVQ